MPHHTCFTFFTEATKRTVHRYHTRYCPFYPNHNLKHVDTKSLSSQTYTHTFWDDFMHTVSRTHPV